MAQLKKYPFLSVSPGVNWQKVDKTLLANLNALGRSRGEIVTLTSGYRSYDEQVALYERYKRSGFNIRYIAAKPGQSNHERGGAVDATIGGKPLALAVKASELAKFGLRAPVKGDPVHTELASKASPSGTTPTPEPAVDQPAAAAPDMTVVAPQTGTPPAAQDPNVEMPGTAQHYLPGSDPISQSWQQIAQLPDLSPDTERLIALSSGG